MSVFGDRKNNSALQKVGMIGGVTTAVLAILAWKYPDRAVFDEHREGIATQKGWPLIGNLPALLSHKETMHNLFLDGFENLGTLTTYVAASWMNYEKMLKMQM